MKEHETKAVFAEIHKAIEESTDSVVASIGADQSPDLTYPPGIELTEEEKKAISDLKLTPEAQSALKKMIADACGYPVFHLCSLLDGVTEPYVIEVEDWVGGSLESNENESMLHDTFYETFWDYEERS